MNHMCTLYGTVKAMLYEWEILLDLPGAAEAVYDMEVKYKQLNRTGFVGDFFI